MAGGDARPLVEHALHEPVAARVPVVVELQEPRDRRFPVEGRANAWLRVVERVGDPGECLVAIDQRVVEIEEDRSVRTGVGGLVGHGPMLPYG